MIVRPKLAPAFVPGDWATLRMTMLSTREGKQFRQQTGLYEEMGYPRLSPVDNEVLTTDEIMERRNERCVGKVRAGERVLIIAVAEAKRDNRWYYLINNGRPHGFGWTRCSDRFEKV